jgi:hypothetical protein
MIVRRLKRDADPEKLKRLVTLVLRALDGKDYRKMTRSEATLVNCRELVEEFEEIEE